MRRACVLVLQRPPYYGHYMMAALTGLGFTAFDKELSNPTEMDLMVTWNRHASRDGPVQRHEKAGGKVIVVENGYFGRNFLGSEWYAMARDHHNGAGWWPEGDERRWRSFNLEMRPWKTDGREIVVLASRGMGHEKLREPSGWSDMIAERARQETGRPVRIRRHPGPQAQCTLPDLVHDLRKAWAVITWGSTAGLKALLTGIPVFYGMDHWIGKNAARHVSEGFSERFTGDREPTFHRVATAMWSRDEIASGKAFRVLTA